MFIVEKKKKRYYKNTFLRKLSNKNYSVNNISIKLNESDFKSLKEQDYFSNG